MTANGSGAVIAQREKAPDFAEDPILSILLRAVLCRPHLVVTVLDVFWIDRSQRDKLKVAAKISEKSDCGLFKLPWNAFIAGRPANAETVDAAARRWTGDEKKLTDWYSDIDGTASLPLARIVCQRTNLRYDSSLRRSYGKVLICLVAAVGVLLIVVASSRNLPFLDFVAVAATVSPAVIWAIRERFRQLDAADTVEIVMGEAARSGQGWQLQRRRMRTAVPRISGRHLRPSGRQSAHSPPDLLDRAT